MKCGYFKGAPFWHSVCIKKNATLNIHEYSLCLTLGRLPTLITYHFYAANLNMKATNFFDSSCTDSVYKKKVTLNIHEYSISFTVRKVLGLRILSVAIFCTPCICRLLSDIKARFKRRTFHVPNAIQTIVNELINLIIYCLNCIRHMKSSTFEPGLSLQFCNLTVLISHSRIIIWHVLYYSRESKMSPRVFYLLKTSFEIFKA